MPTLTTLFTGGGLADIGYHAAGFESVRGIELEPQICEVAKANGIAATEGNILDCDFKRWQRTDALHASPPCTNASVANSKQGETALDIALAEKVAEAINYFRPSVFTMENVVSYRNFKSFQIILNALTKQGYFFDAQHVNFADLGVPQRRVRLIVRAIKDFLPAYPAKETHVGWYAAIEDIIPTLPESEFASWQIKRLEALDFGKWHPETPRDFLTETKFPQRNATKMWHGSEESHPTLTALDPNNRAFLIGTGTYSSPKAPQEPSETITANDNQCTAIKAWLSMGKVVRMTPRANARFQSLPDSYILPEKKSLAQKIIGNGVPCLGMQKIAEQLREYC